MSFAAEVLATRTTYHHPEQTGVLQSLAETIRPFSIPGLEELVSSEAWRQLSPNLPTDDDLSPKDLDATQVAAIVRAFIDPSLTSQDPDHRVLAIDLPGTGRLERIGSVEDPDAKPCYKLTTAEGKHMAVIFANYAPELGVRVPTDPHMSLIDESSTRRLWEYSDLRTYLYVPFSDTNAIEFQELGSEDSRPIITSLVGLTALARRRAMKRIAAHPHSESFVDLDWETARELSHPRHFLRKAGHRLPAVIDVPVTERVRSK